MRDVVIAGVGSTRFGRHLDRTYGSLVSEAVTTALGDAGASAGDAGLVVYGNSGAGVVYGQESVRGQHAVRGTGLDGIPLVNVENACATGSTAVNQAWLAVAAGQVDVAVAIGAEKLNHPDRSRAFAVMTAALDQDRLDEIRDDLGTGGSGSVFMDLYARWTRWYAERTDATPEDFARVAVKNHAHGALNPHAQYGATLTVDEVLAARRISGDLTLPMCAPMSDGAAAAVITTPEIARRWGAQPVRLLATVVGAGRAGAYGELVPATARRAFAAAGVGPEDVDLLECHDAASPAELIVLEELGLAADGGGVGLLRDGVTTLGGRMPVNPSGGLGSKGHPIGATGLGQLVELTDQLRGRCGDRQVEGARIGMAENAGGYLGPDAAAASVTILGAA
ncbi:thiolase family protein [Pseudonocardia endophytica]|uniref:Acetyl-CoA acetyltransferase n=1 Tax=Pseudonocardia endophytica TaxID=401976 RepID=A0A4R1HYQ1_PSEEN|nr:thiolase family protein [Pseudonocardia endophytica]TCK27538.1 acetyl-CoA acetyltransferase [Pseudonocardia endophytica]